MSMVQKTLGIHDAQTGVLRTTMFAGFTVTVFLCGWFVHRFGLKRVSIAGPLFLGVFTVLFALCRNYYTAMAAMFFLGAAGGMLEGAVNTAVSEIGAENRAFSLNMMHVFFGIGASVIPFIAGTLIKHGTMWQSIYIAAGAVTFIISLLFIPQKFPERTSGEQPLKFSDLVRFSMNPFVLLLGACIFFYIGFEIGMNDWTVAYFERFFHLEKDGASSMVTRFWIALAAGRLLCTIVSKWIKPETLLNIATSLTAISAAFIFVTKNPVVAGVLLTLSGLFCAGIFANAIAIGGNRYPDKVGTINGIVIGFSGIGFVFFPTLVGVFSELITLKLAMTVVCVMMFLMAGTSILSSRVGKGRTTGAS